MGFSPDLGKPGVVDSGAKGQTSEIFPRYAMAKEITAADPQIAPAEARFVYLIRSVCRLRVMTRR